MTRKTAIVGVVIVVFAALLPQLSLQLPGILPGATYTPGTLSLLALCLVFASLALSYHLILGTGGMLSFGHALYFGAGSYGLGIVLAQSQLPLWLAVVVTIAVAALLSAATGAVSLRVSGIPFAMVTLAFAQAGSVLVRKDPKGLTGGDEGLSLTTDRVPDSLVGVVNTANVYWLALAVLVLTYAVVAWVDHSRLGSVAEATRENELRVRVLGLQPYVARLVVFVVAGALASLAGMVYLVLQSTALPRNVSTDLTITVLVMVVLGGVGSRWGAIVGGIVYTILNQRLTVLAKSDWIQGLPDVLRVPLSEPLFILGVIFIAVVMFFPGGIAGAVRRLTTRRSTTLPARQAIEAVS